MISQLAKNVASFFVHKRIIGSDKEEIYAYGYEILISEAINWVITIIIALCTASIGKTAFYMMAFIRLREALGGFHAKTHWGCIVISTTVYLLYLFFIYITPVNVYWVVLALGLLLHLGLVVAIAPVAHLNKPFSCIKERQHFRKKSLIKSVFYGAVVVILFVLPWYWSKVLSYSVLLGMLSASLSMAFEFMRQRLLKKGGIRA